MGRHKGRGDNRNGGYAYTHPELEAAAAFSNSEPLIPLTFKGKEAVATTVRYTKIVFAVFAKGYLLVLVHWSQYRQRRSKIGGGLIVPGRKSLEG